MFKACIIGSSEIVYHHIKAIQANNIKIYSICSTRKGSKNSKKIQKKFNIPKRYDDWKECIDENSKHKNIFFVVCPRIKDTYKIIHRIVSKKKPLICEKPLSTNTGQIKKLYNFSKYIFVGYNRIFYKSVKFLSNVKLSNSQINICCPEKSKKSFLENSCHILSIILVVFKKIRIKLKVKNKNYVYCLLEDKKKNLISLTINYNSPTNFSISIKNSEKEILFNPIEQMKLYNKIILTKKNNLNYYQQQKKLFIDLTKSKSKPGFINQYREFKNTVLKGKMHRKANLKLAFEVMNLAKKIVK